MKLKPPREPHQSGVERLAEGVGPDSVPVDYTIDIKIKQARRWNVGIRDAEFAVDPRSTISRHGESIYTVPVRGISRCRDATLGRYVLPAGQDMGW